MKIGIMGAHSTGKTTLMNALREEYPKLHLVSEAARDCPYPLNENTSFKSQEWIIRCLINRETNGSLDDITVSDRTVYDTLAYALYAYENGNITEDEIRLLDKYVFYWGMTYDMIVYIPIEFPLVEDGVRSTDEKYREDIDSRMKDVIKRYVDPERLTVVSGTVEERKEQLKEILYKAKELGIL